MPFPMNINESLISILKEASADCNKGMTFINSAIKSETLTYTDLYEKSLYTLYNLQSRGINRGDELIFQIEDNKDFLIVFWACLIGKIIPVPLSIGSQKDHKLKVIKIWQKLNNPYVIIDDTNLIRLNNFAIDTELEDVYNDIKGKALLINEIREEYHLGNEEKEINSDDLAYIQFSSGSTGDPKGVMLSHSNLITNIRDISSRSEITETDSSLSWMPLTHDMGLICFHLTSVISKINQCILPTTLFIRHPLLWMEKANEYKSSILYSPNFGYQYFLSALQQSAADWDLSRIRLIYNGAEFISADLYNKFFDSLALYRLGKIAMYPGYGLAEASVAVSLPTIPSPLYTHSVNRLNLNIGEPVQNISVSDKNAMHPVSVGFPLEHCSVRIYGTKDETLKENTLGHIQIKGGNVTSGYYNDDELTQELFTADGWLRTGDLGFIRDGQLIITGRAKNIIIINGQNYYPQDIEGATYGIQGITPEKIVVCGVRDQQSISDEPVVFVLFKGATENFIPLIEQIKEAVLRGIGITVEKIIPIRKIPKTTSGKIQNFKLVDEYNEGKFNSILKEISSLLNKNITGGTETILREIFSGYLAFNDIKPSDNFFGLGLSSIQATQLAFKINETFDINISLVEILNNPTIELVTRCIEQSQDTKKADILPATFKEYYDISFSQKRFWLLHYYLKQKGACNISVAYKLEGKFDKNALEKAFNMLITRHESLRTGFAVVENIAKQRVFDTNELTLDFKTEAFEDRALQIQILINEEAEKGFELNCAPLLRVVLISVGANCAILQVTIHHIVYDGWSMEVFFNELQHLYESNIKGVECNLAPLVLQPKDFIEWQNAILLTDNFKKSAAYWMETLSELPPSLRLPFSNYSTDVSNTGRLMRFSLPDNLVSGLRGISRDNDATLFMSLIGILDVLLYKYTGQTDIILGTDVSGRDTADLKDLIGCFINTLPLRIQFSETDTFRLLLCKVKKRILESFEHQFFPFDRIIESLQLETQVGQSPLFNVLVLFQSNSEKQLLPKLGEEIVTSPVDIDIKTSLLDLQLEFIEDNHNLSLHIRYNDRLFEADQIRSLVGHFETLVESIIIDQNKEIYAYTILSDQERQLLSGFNNTKISRVKGISVIDLFEKQVHLVPDAIAVVVDHHTFSYDHINKQANSLAHLLHLECKVKRSDKVVVLTDRSQHLIVAMLGILKSGGAYVPVDTEYPLERIVYMIKDSGAKVIVTTGNKWKTVLDPGNELTFIDLNSEVLQKKPVVNLCLPFPESEELAYVMYTSGSTGRPKGVMIDHEALVDYVLTFIQYFNITSDDIVIQQSSLSFDTVVEEVYPILLVSGKLIIAKEGGRNIKRLAEIIGQERATVLSTTPSVIRELNYYLSEIESLRVIISGGDILRAKDINLLYKKTALYNTYGPTEATVCASFNHIKLIEEAHLIGKPISNHQIYIADDHVNLLPVGIIGEIYIAGAGLARGYFNNEGLTAEKFIDNPFESGTKLYRTGDLGKWTPDGNIVFVGRNDTQININGYRIESGEIENVLLEYPDVANVVVISKTNNDDHTFLVVYYVSNDVISDFILREFLVDRLPMYMIPSYYVHMTAIPITYNGKVDIKALENYEYLTPNPAKEYNTHISLTESKLLSAYNQILEKVNIGIDDNFFALGGNSIKAIQLISAIYKETGVNLKIKNIFLYPTIKQLSGKISLLSSSDVFKEIKPTLSADHYELSNAQKRMWILQQLEKDQVAYNLSWAREFNGSLNIEAFRKAFQYILHRHEILRTTFVIVNGEPKQKINSIEDYPFEFEIISLTKQDSDEQVIADLVSEHTSTRFNLSQGPLLNIRLIQINADKHIFIFNIHHIIADGWSMNIIADELATCYNYYTSQTGDLPDPLKIQYKDYSFWQNLNLQRGDLDEHLQYWKEKLGNISSLNLPVDYLRPSVKTYSGKNIKFIIDESDRKGLSQLSKVHHASLFMILLAAVKVLFYKYTGEVDITIGTPIAGREHPDLQNQIGLYLNTLALRTQFKSNDTFAELLNQVKETTLEAYGHQQYPFDILIDDLDLERDTSHSALFDVMVGYQNIEIAKRKLNEIEGIIDSPYIFPKTISQFDISIDFLESLDELEGIIEYNTDIYSEARITRLVDHYKIILKSILNNIDHKLWQLQYLPDEETALLLEKFNNSGAENIKQSTIQELFEVHVANNPSAIAIIYNEKVLTYQELNQKANQLAWFLRKEYNVTANTLIGLMVNRSENMLIGVMGILKSGAAFVPIDPGYPSDRVKHMVLDSEITVLLSDQDEFDFDLLGIELIDFTAFDAQIVGYPVLNPLNLNSADDLAYVIYTSGSTGKPKGVMVEHRNVLSICESWKHTYELTTFPVRLLQIASISFDVFCGDICRSLLQGGSMIICPSDIRPDPQQLYDLIRTHQINIFESTPALILPLMTYIYEETMDISCMRVLILGSDICLLEDYKNLLQRFGHQMRVINSYGATEATIDSSYFEDTLENLSATGITPIGKPFGNTKLYVLDEYKNLVPVGIAGELYIGGTGVARGYIKDDELTSVKFIDNPYSFGNKLYRTGDICKWLPNGNIEFLGRKDAQVKIRGYRIEPGEIENVLLTHQSVEEAIIVAYEANKGEKILIAYFISKNEVPASDLRAFLKEYLPDYMVPLYFLQLQNFPLSPNGKIDFKALPAPKITDRYSDRPYVKPRNETEIALVTIWQEILKKENIGVIDNFFESGGHSLKATQVVSKIYQCFNARIELRDIFKYPTIEELAKVVTDSEQNIYESIPLVQSSAYYNISVLQRGLWYVNQLDDEQLAYNMPYAYEFEGELNIKAFKKAFKALVNRHESLRTAIISVTGQPKQLIHSPGNFDLEYLDLRARKSKEKIIGKYIDEIAGKRFILSQAPLFASMLLRSDTEKFVFLFSMHHIIADGWSVDILIKEITSLYNSFLKGNVNPLKPLAIQYKDYADWQNKRLQRTKLQSHKDYWATVLSNTIPVLEFPTDYSRPSVKTFNGSSVEIILDTLLSRHLNEISLDHGASLFMMLIASVNALLFKYTGQSDIIIGTPVAGRDQVELENIIGFFVNTIPIRTTFSGDNTFEQLLQNVKSGVLKSFGHQAYPFDYLIEDLNIKRDLSRSPLFDVMVVLENTNLDDGTMLQLAGIKVSEHKLESISSKYDLMFNFREAAEGIMLNLEYNSDLFKKESIQKLLEHYKNLIASIVTDHRVKLNEAGYLSPKEKFTIIESFNDNQSEYPKNSTVHELFQIQAQKTPFAEAVVFEDKIVTYKQLNEYSNKLAHHLKEEFDTRADDLIGLMLDKSEWLMIGILGILKAGGAYVPIDPSFPDNRKNYIIEDSNIKVLITEDRYFKDTVFNSKMDIRNIDVSKQPEENPDFSSKANNLIYAIYTSGTTGKPKGVLIEHASVVNLISWLQKTIYRNHQDPLTAVLTATINFDASVQQLFAPLLSGSKLVLVSDEIKKDPVLFADILFKYRVDVLDITPSYLNVILSEIALRKDKAPIKYTLAGGEPLTLRTAKLYGEVLGISTLINVYGVTEATVNSTFEIISNQKSFKQSIGKSLPNTPIYILDELKNIVAPRITGELYIGGDGVGRGYIGLPELTESRFIPNPFIIGKRLYKTGDLARWRDDGSIEFLGRNDHQVKIRGYRIELEEIENVLREHHEVQDVSVQTKKAYDGEQYLIAYLVFKNGENYTSLSDYLKQYLPDYMIPVVWVTMESFPLTANGKLDTGLLLSYKSEESLISNNYVAPTNKTEAILVNIWQNVLGLGEIGINDDFFELGGHSLKAAQIIYHIHKELQSKITLKEFFLNPNIGELAKLIPQALFEQYSHIPPLEKSNYYDLSHAQKRMWITNEIIDTPTAYNISGSYLSEGDLDLLLLEEVLKTLVNRHESLRTKFKIIGGEPKQIIVEPGLNDLKFQFFDLGQDNSWEQTVKNLISKELDTTFSLEDDLLFKVNSYKIEEEKYILLFKLHHIIADEWSTQLIVKEVITLYDAYSKGNPNPLPELVIQYKDYAAWDNKQLTNGKLNESKEYWLKQLEGDFLPVGFPLDYERSEIRSYTAAYLKVPIEPNLYAGIKKLARKNRTSLFTVLLTGINALIYRYTTAEDIILGIPVAGRNHNNLEDQIGFYSNTLALRTKLKDNQSFSALLDQVKENTTNAYEHQSYPFDCLLEDLDLKWERGRSPLFEIMVAYQNSLELIEFNNIKLHAFPIDQHDAKFDLLITFTEGGEKLFIDISYRLDLFKEESIKLFVERLQILFKEVLDNETTYLNNISFNSPSKDEQEKGSFNQSFDFAF
jgi:tyrocidine synthetase III